MVLKIYNQKEIEGLELAFDLTKKANPPHPLTSFNTLHQNESRFHGVYSRDNLLEKIKVRAYVINLGEYSDAGTH